MSLQTKQLRYVPPKTAMDDCTDRHAGNPVAISNRPARFALLSALAYFGYLLLVNFCHPVENADASRAVTLAVHDISSLCVDSQVPYAVVGLDTVVMADDMFCWYGSDKGLGYQPLNSLHVRPFQIIPDDDVAVSILVNKLGKHASAATSATCMASYGANASLVGNLVTPLKADDRQPIFGYDSGIHDVNLRNRLRCGESRFGAYNTEPARIVLAQSA